MRFFEVRFFVLVALFGASANLAQAKIVATGPEANRADQLAHLQQICMDYPLSINVETDEIDKGERYTLETSPWLEGPPNEFEPGTPVVEPSNLTPVGCDLVCQLMEHHLSVTLSHITRDVGVTVPHDMEKASDPELGSSCTVYIPAEGNAVVYREGDAGISSTGVTYDCTNPMPRWLTTAHELIHALHSLTGTVLTTPGDNETSVVSGLPPNALNPGITENAIRAEQSGNSNPPIYPPRIVAGCGRGVTGSR